MIDFHKDIVNTLQSILPTYYEMKLTSDSATPCISYMEISNVEVTDSHYSSCTLGYSRINYQVKVWADNLADIQKYAKQIDNKLRVKGWKRTSSSELYDNQSSMIQKILNYECLALEKYTEV